MNKLDRAFTMFDQSGVNFDPSARVALKELQDEVIAELERLGAPAAAIHYIVTELLGHGLRRGQISQRVRRAKERRERVAEQEKNKPLLKERALSAYRARCAYCDRVGAAECDPDGKPWHLDRILPGAFGGEYAAENVALACEACNRKKGSAVTFCPPPSLAQLEAA